MSKKTILALAILLTIGFTFTSCKKDKQEEVKTEEMVSYVVYQCPMDCEDGKSYTEPGQCPVCEMDLKAKEVDMDGDTEMETDSTNHDGHDHE
ncbi:MAG: heavy metal-binding domain-containing protein, partial [Aureibaculum sp.]